MDYRKFNRFLSILQPEQVTMEKGKHPVDYPNAFGRLAKISGRDYNNIDDIHGAKPSFMFRPRINRENDYKLVSKDVTEAYKKVYVKDHNPLDPRYANPVRFGLNEIVLS